MPKGNVSTHTTRFQYDFTMRSIGMAFGYDFESQIKVTVPKSTIHGLVLQSKYPTVISNCKSNATEGFCIEKYDNLLFEVF